MSENGGSRWGFEHTRLKMSSFHHLNLHKNGDFRYPRPISPSSSPSPFTGNFNKGSAPPSSPPSSSGTRINPAVLFIIVILAALFFIAGLLHLLVRFLVKHPSSSASPRSNRHPEISSSDVLQRQLQQLFHLHDSGLDQAFIDALPVFHYRDIVGLKEPFDCAVCLSEFSDRDKLRLLTICSHAFHVSCIDTWLLSNSTCPLCRGTLFAPGFPIENPIFDFDDLREEDLCSAPKIVENEEIVVEKRGFPVRFGKFKRLDVNEAAENQGETSSRNMDARRCFSMGSYQYVVGNSKLRVPFKVDEKQPLKDAELDNGGPVVADGNGKKITMALQRSGYGLERGDFQLLPAQKWVCLLLLILNRHGWSLKLMTRDFFMADQLNTIKDCTLRNGC